MSTNFIHLNLHTEYSIVDGLIDIKNLVKTVADVGMPAVAMTDQCNLFAMVKFYKAALAAGVKPIIGADMWLHNAQDGKKPFRLVLLCQNQIGYKNLTQLISKAYLEGQQTGVPIIQKTWLKELSAGLIALSGGQAGDIGQALLSHHAALANALLQEWQDYFPSRFYLEIQRVGKEHEEIYIQAIRQLAHAQHIPIVATNAVCFLSAEDFEAHEARVCIHGGWILEEERRPKNYTEQQYLRSAEEMQQLFADIPEAITNTLEIARRCSLELNLGKSFLPNFPIPANISTEKFFEAQAKQGLELRLQKLFGEHISTKRQAYDERLQMEIEVIEKMGFPGYFLIVADFIHWSRSNDIPVGPGRGSGAGSLVAYALGITDLDPIAHELLFERFLNPERISMPDFDIDFCMEGRDRVIEYVAEKYGRDSVSQIITYGTMAARAVVRDVGRVLAYPYGFVDKIAKLIPFELGMTLEKALKDEDLLKQRYQTEDEVRTLIDLARKLEGVPRNVGKHAGGVVIAPSVLTDFAPLYCEVGGDNRVTQFDKDDVEAVGLVKFDFLGLRTLTIIHWAVTAINQQRSAQNEPLLDVSVLPLNDEKTFELLRACLTTAVFQLESRGMKDLVKRLQPDCFDDIVALVALFRPGPLQSGMVDDYINCKHGKAKIEYSHPLLEAILRPTNGVILYQEQVMQIAQVMGGYTLGGADLLRRAMGKKKAEEMAKQRAIFVEGAKSRQVDVAVANQIFSLMEKFGDYGFNKSHSAAYAVLAYQTAWLKAHYSAEFMAAVLSSDMDNTDKVVRFIEDCQQLQLKILLPDINKSNYQFTVENKQEIRYGLGAIKGVGSAAVDTILEAQKLAGNFSSLFEFCQRVDTRKVNRKVLEALIRSGCLDTFHDNRASLMASIDLATQTAEQRTRNLALGQNDLFGGEVSTLNNSNLSYVSCASWNEQERLAGEKETLGWYMSGHPLARFEEELKQFITAPIVHVRPSHEQTAIIAGYISAIRTLHTKNGNRMAFVSLQDRSGRIDLAVFADIYDKYRELLVADQLLVVEGEVSVDDFNGGYKISGQRLYDLSSAREKFAKRLVIKLHEQQFSSNLLQNLTQALTPFCGGTFPVYIEYQHAQAKAQLLLDAKWRVKPTDNLLQQLYAVCNESNVVIEYVS